MTSSLLLLALLSGGADQELANAAGQTPIDVALDIQCAEMVALLESQTSTAD